MNVLLIKNFQNCWRYRCKTSADTKRTEMYGEVYGRILQTNRQIYSEHSGERMNLDAAQGDLARTKEAYLHVR